MANTTIQLKFSTATATPTLLNVAEPAYSYTSNTLFIGSPASTGSIAIGGKFYLDQQQIIFDSVNAAFTAANTSLSANLAFNQANAAFITANSAGVYANGAFLAANAAQDTATSAGVYANGAFAAANTAQNSATAAFNRANNSISANAGGTITGSLVVTGNLTVQGNTTFIDTEILSVEDSLIKLANNNTSDTLDIGFYGQYDSSGVKYAGLARSAASDNFFLFKGLTDDPAGNTLASGSVTAANAATLIANVSAYSITIGNQNIQTYTDNAFNTANAAFAKANTQDAINLTQNNSITAAFSAANTAQVTATSAGVYANGAFAVANTDVTNISISAADHGSAAAVAAFRVEANGRISSANSTAIAIDASAITSGTLGVVRGGTGAGTFTNNGVLLGQGTSAFTTATSSTEGHVLTINNSGVPTFAHLQGGTF
jgi:trimeric autotransporter adhesin